MKIHRLRINRGIKSRDHLISPASLYTKVRKIRSTNLTWCKLMDTTQTMRAPESHLSRNIWAHWDLPLTIGHHLLRHKTMEVDFTLPKSRLVLQFSFLRNILTYKATSCRSHPPLLWHQTLGNRPVWNQITSRATWENTLIQWSLMFCSL